MDLKVITGISIFTIIFTAGVWKWESLINELYATCIATGVTLICVLVVIVTIYQSSR